MGLFEAAKFAVKAFKNFDEEMLKEYQDYSDEQLIRIIKRRIGNDSNSTKYVDYEDSRLAAFILNSHRRYTATEIKEAIARGYF